MIKASLFGLANGIGYVNPRVPTDILVQVVTIHLKEQEKCLLVIDNLDSEDFSPVLNRLVNDSWVGESNASILITSRLEERQLKGNIGLKGYLILMKRGQL